MAEMSLEERKILAMVECMLIWDLLASGKFLIKSEAILHLMDNEMIADCTEFDCPFCTHLRDNVDAFGELACMDCMWPGYGYVRCTYSDIFQNWSFDHTPENAKAVFDMLKSIEF